MNMLKTFLLTFFAVATSYVSAQIELPSDKVKWTFELEQKGAEATVIVNVKCEEHWHINAVKLPKGSFGFPTSLKLDKSKDFTLAGGIIEPKPIEKYDDLADEQLSYHEGSFKLKQKIKVTSDKDFFVQGTFSFQTCNEVKCLPDFTAPFKLKVKGVEGTDTASEKDTAASVQPNVSDTVDKGNSKVESESVEAIKKEEKQQSSQSYGLVFLLAFLSGFAALIMPCVFPMIPMTVSFFTKRSKTRAEGIKNAMIYGASIVVIHFLLGLLVVVTGSSSLLNEMSTNVWFNLFFFLMLFVFGMSFLGAFEIQLPSSWVNAADSKADKGGMVGIFFMALVLSLASFSCTGPILGSLLVGISAKGGDVALLIGMFAFGLALALPFMLFSIFPAMMNSLPSSGGWLNVVKVFLGFVEIAFAFKFLSTVDTTLQLHLLEREIFIAIEVAIFAALALYLFGKYKLPHDSEVERLSVGRTLTATCVLAFTIYLLPGMWGAPLKLVNAYLPPDFYAESPKGIGGGATAVSSEDATEHEEGMHEGPQGTMAFNDYDKALAYAKKVNKPLFVDFTGWGCVNCRKMEQTVWGQTGIIEHLREDVVIVSLYVDERTELPKSEQTSIDVNGTNFAVKTIGNKWTAKQITEYKTSSQPYYVMKYPDGKDIEIGSADYQNHSNPEVFKKWLDSGLEAFNKQK
jgi:thiol:disulfide interchange protein DsbD